MAVKLNLLPQGAGVPASLGKSLRLVKNTSVVLLALFLFFVLGISTYLVWASLSVRSLAANEESLKARVKSLESTEQKMVLLKDRLAKIEKAKSSPSVAKDLDKVAEIIGLLPEGAILTEMNLDQKKTDFSVVFRSSSDLSSFLAAFKTKKDFKRASLVSFSFNPSSGYSVGLRFFEN